MNYKKLLPLLLVMVVWINYMNYFQVDEKKLNSKIELLESRIAQEREITELYKDEKLLKKLKEKTYYKEMMLDEQMNYSKAMGLLQDTINKSAKGNCTVLDLKWGSKIPSDTWYSPLKISARMECSPEGFVAFKNRLVKTKKIYKFENLKISKQNKHQKLYISFQFIAYKLGA